MSEREFQPELDDELLSAYLDDELSAEERAAVDARLANDVEAQQLLHHLRAVSQSIQMLPLEPVGRDLRDEILRRAKATKPNSGGNGGSAGGLGDIVPQVSVFGSRRSWVWASLAVAAGLMIMVLERGEEKGNQLPAVAQNGQQRRQRLIEEQKPAAPVVENSPRPEAASAPIVAGTEVDQSQNGAAGSPTSSGAKPQTDVDQLLARDRAAGAPSGIVAGSAQDAEANRQLAAEATPGGERRLDSPLAIGGGSRVTASATFNSPTSVAKDKTPVAPSASGGPSGAGGESAAARSKSDVAGKLDHEGGSAEVLVVVQVVAKSGSFRGGSFEKMLEENRIGIEQQEQLERSPADEVNKKSTDQLFDGSPKSPPNGDVDMVLVEAPKDVVTACLADLQRDELNYVSVQVDPRATGELDTKADLAKTLGYDLSRYNRGISAQKQDIREQSKFYADDAAKKRSEVKDETVGNAAAKAEQSRPSEKEVLHQPVAGVETRGRALRLMASDDRKGPANEAKLDEGRLGGFGGGGGSAWRRAAIGRNTSADSNGDEVRVLFVVREEEPPPTISPEKKAAK